MAKVRLVMENHGLGALFIDGARVDGVTAVTIGVRAGETNSIMVEIVQPTIEVIGDFEIGRSASHKVKIV